MYSTFLRKLTIPFPDFYLACVTCLLFVFGFMNYYSRRLSSKVGMKTLRVIYVLSLSGLLSFLIIFFLGFCNYTQCRTAGVRMLPFFIFFTIVTAIGGTSVAISGLRHFLRPEWFSKRKQMLGTLGFGAPWALIAIFGLMKSYDPVYTIGSTWGQVAFGTVAIFIAWKSKGTEDVRPQNGIGMLSISIGWIAVYFGVFMLVVLVFKIIHLENGWILLRRALSAFVWLGIGAILLVNAAIRITKAQRGLFYLGVLAVLVVFVRLVMINSELSDFEQWNRWLQSARDDVNRSLSRPPIRIMSETALENRLLLKPLPDPFEAWPFVIWIADDKRFFVGSELMTDFDGLIHELGMHSNERIYAGIQARVEWNTVVKLCKAARDSQVREVVFLFLNEHPDWDISLPVQVADLKGNTYADFSTRSERVSMFCPRPIYLPWIVHADTEPIEFTTLDLRDRIADCHADLDISAIRALTEAMYLGGLKRIVSLSVLLQAPDPSSRSIIIELPATIPWKRASQRLLSAVNGPYGIPSRFAFVLRATHR